MNYAMDTPIRFGAQRVAVLTRRDITPRRMGNAFAVSGGKRPVAVLIENARGLRALTLEGTEMTLEEIEALCPGAVKRFTDSA